MAIPSATKQIYGQTPLHEYAYVDHIEIKHESLGATYIVELQHGTQEMHCLFPIGKNLPTQVFLASILVSSLQNVIEKMTFLLMIFLHHLGFSKFVNVVNPKNNIPKITAYGCYKPSWPFVAMAQPFDENPKEGAGGGVDFIHGQRETPPPFPSSVIKHPQKPRWM